MDNRNFRFQKAALILILALLLALQLEGASVSAKYRTEIRLALPVISVE